MKIKVKTIKTKNWIVEVTDRIVTIKDLEGFPLVKIEPDKIKVKKEIKVVRI